MQTGSPTQQQQQCPPTIVTTKHSGNNFIINSNGRSLNTVAQKTNDKATVRARIRSPFFEARCFISSRYARATPSNQTVRHYLSLILISLIALNLLGRHLETVEGQQLFQSKQQNNNQNHNNDQQRKQRTASIKPASELRPDSSSSFFAEVEDLQDSSIRTKFGTVLPMIALDQTSLAAQNAQHLRASSIEHLGTETDSFDRLIERLLPNEGKILQQNQAKQQINNKVAIQQTQPQQQQLPQLQDHVFADANNKTSMRFFRNNKTFASVVYTNRIDDKQPRRLINCHLVDLERHSSDVALYEAKYDIKTMDVEFREMMQLIEACTNIARFKRKPVLLISGGNKETSQGNSPKGPPQQSTSPLVIVRPPLAGPQPQQAQQLQLQQQPVSNNPQSLSSFHKIMSGALNNELKRLGQPIDDSNRLDLPSSYPTSQSGNLAQGRTRRTTNSGALFPLPQGTQPTQQQRQQQHHQQQQQQQQPQRKEQKLFLAEVTAPPSPPPPPPPNGPNAGNAGHKHAAGQNGSLREAIQEITSYDTSDLLSIWRGILPGTNWCGMGDRATSYNDLGFESDIDICCRAHDFCPIRLSAFSAGYGLFNWSFYTRSHCWCDQNFLDCLQQAESPLSSVVMKFYFSIMKTTCLNDNETHVRKREPQNGSTSPASFASNNNNSKEKQQQNSHNQWKPNFVTRVTQPRQQSSKQSFGEQTFPQQFTVQPPKIRALSHSQMLSSTTVLAEGRRQQAGLNKGK